MSKNGHTNAGTTRYRCTNCGASKSRAYDKQSNDLTVSLNWLLSNKTQDKYSYDFSARTLRRKNKLLWDLWPQVPFVDEVYDYIHVDGIHLGRKSVVLIAYSGKHVLGWYVARSENSRAWGYLMQRIAEPLVVVCDGSGGIRKAVKTYWPNTKIQRCLFHIGLNIKALTGVNPRLTPGKQLLSLANIVSDIKTENQARHWLISYNNWVNTWSDFLKEKSKYCDGSIADTHQRLVRAKSMIDRRIHEGYMFTFLSPPEDCNHPIPPTNNAIESMNSRIRVMLRNHRGLSLLKRIHAICWWCYLNTSKPRDKSWIVTHSFTSKRIEQLYRQAWERSNQGLSEVFGIPARYGTGVDWNEFHKSREYYQ